MPNGRPGQPPAGDLQTRGRFKASHPGRRPDPMTCRSGSENRLDSAVKSAVGLARCAVVALPPVPGEGDEVANDLGRQPRSARDVPQRRVLILGLSEVRRPHLGFPACEYPPARTRAPTEPVLDHAEGAGGNVLAVLELS